MATATSTKTQVFTKEELEALRKALNMGRNGMGDYAAPPEEGREESDDWRNDVSLLVKFLRDIGDVLQMAVSRRVPEPARTGMVGLLLSSQGYVDAAIEELNAIDGPGHRLWEKLVRAGLAGEALLAKLDEWRDRAVNGPLLSVLELGNTILGSLATVLHLEPLKEAKEVVENRMKYGSDDEIIQLHLVD
jgi:energy-converting hydrogenase Eha subunit C